MPGCSPRANATAQEAACRPRPSAMSTSPSRACSLTPSAKAHQRNVADLADAPTTNRNSRTMSVWTSDELRAFLEAISDHYLYPLYLLAASTGMRRAEIAGLVWRNVDLDTARLTVSQQLCRDAAKRLGRHVREAEPTRPGPGPRGQAPQRIARASVLFVSESRDANPALLALPHPGRELVVPARAYVTKRPDHAVTNSGFVRGDRVEQPSAHELEGIVRDRHDSKSPALANGRI